MTFLDTKMKELSRSTLHNTHNARSLIRTLNYEAFTVKEYKHTNTHIRKLHNNLPRLPLLTIYETFIKPYLDYGYITYYQAYNILFHQKLESIQYNSALDITDAVRETSTEILYNELGLETLEKRRWYRKLCRFYKVCNRNSPKKLYLTLIPLPLVQITQEILIIFLNSKSDITFFEIPFSLLWSLNGINWI